ncbi:MAG: hypothetical protein ABJ004_15110 [Cyclobacteriaceae bacterium]
MATIISMPLAASYEHYMADITKKQLLAFHLLLLLSFSAMAQSSYDRYPQLKETLTPFRLPLPIEGSITYIYLDADKDPDGLKATLPDGTKILWLDDDDDMQKGDLEGDLDSDCLMVDLNGDGLYGSELDLILDYLDINDDGKADFQVIVDNGKKAYTGKWTSHYMWFADNDNDGVFGYVNWDSFKFEGWDHQGRANFFADYNGQSTMLKAHITTWNIKDPEYSWENPFLFYDTDGDGLTEMAIRMVDEPIETESKSDLIAWKYSHQISLVQMTFDMDNDSHAGNELDYDLSLRFAGKGFDYSDQVNSLGSYSIAPGLDQYFDDPRWRHLKNLVYPTHETAYDLTFDRGKWSSCWLVFDEDDDCHRWERVEFYDPKDPFKIGAKNDGLDHNPQSDAVGDRGEWDLDFSGKGSLYVSPLDGKLHLFGAETGYWRIDQNSLYYQGWQGWRGPNIQPEDTDTLEPTRFATIKYEDTDGNGFFDEISYDMNGDTLYEEMVCLLSLGLSDQSEIFHPSEMDYSDYLALHESIANGLQTKAAKMEKMARDAGLNTQWYSFLGSPKSTREKYHNGFWMSYYLYRDLSTVNAGKNKALRRVKEVYFSK